MGEDKAKGSKVVEQNEMLNLVLLDKQKEVHENNGNEEIEIHNEENQLNSSLNYIIPETEMDMIRKSLEDEKNQDLISLNISNQNSNEGRHNEDLQILQVENNDDDVQVEDLSENRQINDVVPSTSTANEIKSINKKRQVKMTKTYVDFLSDDEDFVWDSSSWKESDIPSSDDDVDSIHKKKRTKIIAVKERDKDLTVGERGFKKKKINKRVEAKKARVKGQSYLKKDGTVAKAKSIKQNPCKKCSNKCDEITEDKRQSLFDHFWSLTHERKKDWLVGLSRKCETKRKRSKESAYRTNTFEYFINHGEGQRQVCLQFLLKTLDVSQKFVYYTLSNASYGSAKEDLRGKTIPSNKTKQDIKDSVINFIKSLPALPSHYCRKDSEKLYLPVEFKNTKNLYRIYKEDRTSRGVDVVSEKIFREIFKKEFNIGFHVPKKDKCVKCLRFETESKNEESQAKSEHLEEKQASKQRFECHRELGKQNSSILCTSYDLQKVLNTPHGNSMLLFYSRKYAVYNLCFYESQTREGFCYIWGESEGKRGGNEISSILEKYITEVDMRGTIKHLILYSDSCPGQNKNRIVLAAVHNTLLQCKNLESIQLNYLLPGHTEMPVDSMHSVIENSVKNTIIWAPSQWITICQIARKEVTPYHVHSLDHNDFKGFDELADKYFKGNLTGKISKIRVATFKKSTPQKMSVRYTMKVDAIEENILLNTGKANKSIKTNLYKFSLPITKMKYNDLIKLCDSGVIPKIFHSEYKNLTCGNVKDVLNETDIEDESEEE